MTEADFRAWRAEQERFSTDELDNEHRSGPNLFVAFVALVALVLMGAIVGGLGYLLLTL